MKDKIIAAFTLGLTVAAACYVLNAGSCGDCEPTARVVVAAEYLPQGAIITEDKLAVMSVPRKYMQFGCFEVRGPGDIKGPIGLATLVRIPKGDQVTQNCLSEDGRRTPYNGPGDRVQQARLRYLEGLKYFQNNDYGRAREEWRAARSLDPQNRDADNGLRRLERVGGLK